jgi:hypothetical protein
MEPGVGEVTIPTVTDEAGNRGARGQGRASPARRVGQLIMKAQLYAALCCLLQELNPRAHTQHGNHRKNEEQASTKCEDGTIYRAPTVTRVGTFGEAAGTQFGGEELL